MNIPEGRRWLVFAQEDLRAAEAMSGRSDAYPRHVCWLAQQAAEKALKAIFVFLEIEFPYTHDLDRLRDLLPDGWGVKGGFPDLAELTEWAVEARYPGDMPDIVDADAQRAVQQARAILETVRADFDEHTSSSAG